MKTALVATLFALASLPLLAQQAPMNHPSNTPGAQQNAPQESSPAANAETSANPETSATQQLPVVELRPVSAKLVSKLDTKTAKKGDDIVVETGASVKTADGTEIPKGSKLMGHVLAVHPSGGQNSQVVLQFDHAELKDGQKLPIHSEIQSIAPSASRADSISSGAMNGASADNAPGPATGASAGGAMASGGSKGMGTPGSVPEAASGGATTGATAAPAAGTIVSRDGKIAIRITSVPGVLLANNAPGEQDPRMAQAAGILVGAKRDIQLDGGTQMVIGVATGGANTQ